MPIRFSDVVAAESAGEKNGHTEMALPGVVQRC
jgi:hypothetical protein